MTFRVVTHPGEAGQSIFAMPADPAPLNTVVVNVNGVVLAPAAYTYTALTLTLATPLAAAAPVTISVDVADVVAGSGGPATTPPPAVPGYVAPDTPSIAVNSGTNVPAKPVSLFARDANDLPVPLRASGSGHLVASALPTAQSVSIVSVNTQSVGANWSTFPSAPAALLVIVNTSGTTIEYRRGGAGSTIKIPNNTAWKVTGITNANQIQVRRLDQSNTPVAVDAEAVVV